MQYSTLLIGLLAAASSAFAAPAPNTRSEAVSAMADVPQWIIRSFTRTCNDDDTSCEISFGVDTQIAPVTECSYNVTGNPASQTSTNGITCGPYTISSGWDPLGFTTWSVVDWSKHLIVWPAYSDAELVNGQPVTPDKSFAPQALP
ncbi:hypothetical protein MYCTH_2314963 [Thermothelomyces thermophilus ATCC 42464]|uniref:Small secreted protein n=1 Tax=Thermothelomyces thermophilus (strain ATCC 42464 / BCRC 31852 / DSM 1799) TaxID=573729 RepID=G2QBS7_THET4|nr:uncharacterized protein MYCTH_2314963 [Thermothelomyces thermophilus ATCC 42464]AEO57208.1 hypothetical protein MYCTH_2314963 [Thermothelomyces thermophilus ATCC 42464]